MTKSEEYALKVAGSRGNEADDIRLESNMFLAEFQYNPKGSNDEVTMYRIVVADNETHAEWKAKGWWETWGNNNFARLVFMEISKPII